MTESPPETQCQRFFISGKVQGVWFRDSARRQANNLKLSGYARNLDDGRVEVLACGASESIEKLATWLAKGPPLARVAEVDRKPADPDDVPESFSTG